MKVAAPKERTSNMIWTRQKIKNQNQAQHKVVIFFQQKRKANPNKELKHWVVTEGLVAL